MGARQYQDKQLRWGRGKNGGGSYDAGNISVGEPYRRVYFLKKNPLYTDGEAIVDILPYYTTVNSNTYNTDCYSWCEFYSGRDSNMHSECSTLGGTLSGATRNTTYTTRVNPSDNRVELAVENDRIKVSTDGHPGYAVPAECNVDIVLAIPTNMAACNKDNRDANTTTSGAPTIITTNTVTILDSATLFQIHSRRKCWSNSLLGQAVDSSRKGRSLDRKISII